LNILLQARYIVSLICLLLTVLTGWWQCCGMCTWWHKWQQCKSLYVLELWEE